MSGLTPEEKNEVIDQIHGLVESLREDEYGIEIRGCRGAAGWLLGIGILLLLGYVFLSFGGLARAVFVGIILSIAAASLIVYFFIRATR